LKFKESLFEGNAPNPIEGETREWYDPYEPIVPSYDGEMSGQYPKEANYSEFREKFAKKIVFQSGKPIQRDGKDDSGFITAWEYSPGNKVFGRAYWPVPIGNFQLGKSRTDGKPVYGPKKIKGLQNLEMVLRVFIDGKVIPNGGAPDDDFRFCFNFIFIFIFISFCFSFFDRSSGASFWTSSQSCNFHVLSDPVDDYEDTWTHASQKMAHHLVASGAGKKLVRFELSFRLVPKLENLSRHKAFPWAIHPLSAPLASGELTVTMPNGSVCPDFLPSFKNPFSSDVAQQFLDYMKNHREWGKRNKLREVPIRLSICSNFYVSATKWYEIVGMNRLQEHPSSYAIDFKLLVYRSPTGGWDSEHCAVFDLSMQVDVGVNEEPDLAKGWYFQGVGGNVTFSVDHLSQADIEQIPQRCPEEKRIAFKG
jgi:hypothetical protein